MQEKPTSLKDLAMSPPNINISSLSKNTLKSELFLIYIANIYKIF